MKSRRVLQLSSLLLLASIFLSGRSSRRNNDNTLELKTRKYGLHDCRTFFLKDLSGRCVDSVTIYDLSFKVDSLVQEDKYNWQYTYKVRCGVGCGVVKQLFMNTEKRKIEITYVFYSVTSIDYGAWGPPPEGRKGAQYVVKKTDNSVILHRSEFNDQHPAGFNFKTYRLQYDKKRQAWYNKKFLYRSPLTVSVSPDFERETISVSDSCCAIVTADETAVKIGKRWYRYRKDDKVFLDFQ